MWSPSACVQFVSFQHVAKMQNWHGCSAVFCLFFALHFDKTVYIDNCLNVGV